MSILSTFLDRRQRTFAALLVFAMHAYAGEAYLYQGTSSFNSAFYLIGGKYTLYLYARRPILGYNAPETKSCIFGGSLKRVWPTQETVPLGSGITISTIVPHKIGPAPITLAAGTYLMSVAPLTTCDWHFVLESSAENSAGVQPVAMFKIGEGKVVLADTASLADHVQFSAQYRSENDRQEQVSGTLQLLNEGNVVQTFPLEVDRDKVSGATTLHRDLQWQQSDAKYVGKNTAKFVVKIGSQELTSTGDFTLTK